MHLAHNNRACVREYEIPTRPSPNKHISSRAVKRIVTLTSDLRANLQRGRRETQSVSEDKSVTSLSMRWASTLDLLSDGLTGRWHAKSFKNAVMGQVNKRLFCREKNSMKTTLDQKYSEIPLRRLESVSSNYQPVQAYYEAQQLYL